MPDFQIVKMTEALVPEGLEVLCDAFFTGESVCKAVGLLSDSPRIDLDYKYQRTEASLELEKLNADVAKDGLSLVAIDPVTDEVLGASFNKLQVKPPKGTLGYFEKFAQENIKSQPARSLVDYMNNVDSRLDLFGHFQAECGLELMMIAVKHKAQGRGIAKALTQKTIEIAREFKGSPKPAFVSAIFTSRFSRKAGDDAGMETLLEIPFSEFEYQGRKYSDVIGTEHPTCTLAAINLQKNSTNAINIVN